MDNDGVFGHTTDRAAFIDRVDLGIWGKRRTWPLPWMVTIDRNFPIGGPKSMYARCVDGFCPVTGNPFQEKYGVMRWPDRVPERRLTLRSQRTPLSGAQVELVSRSLMRKGFRSQVSQAEMTFDFTGTSIGFIKRHLLTTARRFQSYRDELGRETYYVGGFKSPWQVRIYQKRDDVVRFEFIFRREFLRNKGISRPHELVLLRKIDLNRLVWLREKGALEAKLRRLQRRLMW
jgi:hypothetical protein